MRARTIFDDEAMDQVRFGLFDATMDYDAGDDWGRDVLRPWLSANPSIVAALHRIGEPGMASVSLDPEDRWALYALSRVVDLLLLPHQPPSIEPGHPADWLPATAYGQFVAGIGGTTATMGGFHPFLHEIVAVQPAEDPAEPPSIAGQWWPACMIGSMVLTRGGVTVRAGSDHLDPEIASHSVLYWAWRRRYRKAEDLSHGWGSNSQWRTDFRRDYRLGDRLAYNVDAALEPVGENGGGPTFNGDLDLIRHRCSTRVDHGPDQWVWDTAHSEPSPC